MDKECYNQSAAMSNFRLWLYRSLVSMTAGLMVISFIRPWWIADISAQLGYVGTIKIYAYGFSHNLDNLPEYLAGDITPFYQTVLAWVYLAASVGLILYSTWLRGRKGRWLLGGVGLIFIAYATIAVIWIATRTGDLGIGIPLQGYGLIMEGGRRVDIDTSLQFGYYLTYGAGLMCIALALLRNKIVGKPKLNA